MAAHPPEPDASQGRSIRPRPRQRGPWAVGLGVSVAVHLVLLLMYGGVAGPPTVSVSPTGEGISEIQGMELLNLVARAEDEPDRPDDPDTERQAVPVLPTTPSQREAEGRPGEAAPERAPDPGPLGPTAADRLRVRVGDERLWAPLASDELGELTMQQFLESDLAWRLGLWQDSAAMELARQRRSLDWTWTDDEGGRWGVSPEGIHLGSVTLPLPAFIDAEVARGTAQGLVWETLQDRAEAMRRRRDAEREEAAREAAQAGPRRTRPDTTGVRRDR